MKKLIKQAQQLLATTALILLVACSEKVPEHSQVSEQPPEANREVKLASVHESVLSTRARIAYADLAALAEEEVPAEHTDTGKQKICKKVIGMKVCGNARWNYTVLREGNVNVAGADDFVEITVPMRFFGKAGIGGDVAKVLRLDALDFNGAMLAKLRLKLDLTEDWCPSIATEMTYEWTRTPRLKWKGGVDMNLKDEVDKAISKQLAGLEEKASAAIDCEQFRNTIQTQWKQHSIPLDLPSGETVHLNIVPSGFSFSGIKTEADKLGLAFTLNAQTSVQSESIAPEPLPLPALSRTDYQPGVTEFNVLIRAAYSQLQTLAEQELIGRQFVENSKAGEVAVDIDSITLSGNPSGVTVNLGFRAKLPGKKHLTPGNVFLTATPVLEPFTQTVRLENIELSNVLDSTLWNAIAAVFNKKIITELENKAVFALGPKLTEMSDLLESQLSDPSRTSGLAIADPKINLILEDLVPEQDSLAAILKVQTQLDIDVPIKTLYRQSKY